MIMYAHLVDNVVRQLEDTNPAGKYPAEMVWVECPDNTEQGATYNPSSKTFTARVLQASPNLKYGAGSPADPASSE